MHDLLIYYYAHAIGRGHAFGDDAAVSTKVVVNIQCIGLQ